MALDFDNLLRVMRDLERENHPGLRCVYVHPDDLKRLAKRAVEVTPYRTSGGALGWLTFMGVPIRPDPIVEPGTALFDPPLVPRRTP